ncbi:MAG TPA: prolyl oligopeptidase family serine peptidase [Rhodothermales bacterium]|nr:prolyl oligopeptidase family serine peptidase [Rhodothermales bacterium]
MKKSFILLVLVALGVPLFAQNAYQLPPPDLKAVADAPNTPSVSLSPDYTTMAILETSDMPPIAELAEPELRLAGLRIKPATNGASRGGFITAMSFRSLSDQKEVKVLGVPSEGRMGFPAWSPDSKRVAFTVTFKDRIEIWGTEVKSGKALRLSTRKMNTTLNNACSWQDNIRLLCFTIPTDRKAAPIADLAPKGPVIQENLGRAAPARTFQDLLRNEHDEALFDHYFTSQPVMVSWGGITQNFGPAAIYDNISTSPDGNYFLVSTIRRPYSYLVTVGAFPRKLEVWDKKAKTVYVVAELPLQDTVPIGFNATTVGVRGANWRPDLSATLFWVEALDGGDPKNKVPFRDQVYTLSAPFLGEKLPIAKTEQRFAGIMWGDHNLALISDTWTQTRSRRMFIMDPSKPMSEFRKLLDLNTEDRYNNPGSPLMKRNQFDRMVLRTTNDGKSLYMQGIGATPEGNRPFLHKMSLEDGKSTELWRAQAPYYESVVALLPDGQSLMTRRESQSEVPNYFIRTLGTDKLKQITQFPDPYPQLQGISKEIIRYKRNDGVDLNAILYLPKGYKKENGPLPTFIWAYPAEFKDAAAAGQVSGSPFTFTRISAGSALMLVLAGYAVLDNASMPIVGVGKEEPNDTFVEQLVASAKAAIDEGVRRGVVDPDRVAVGGHSYGAFMTANLLAHSDLFRAGVARSGAYNRTLTPFGFQNEERTIWQAPEVYSKMSPFMFAHKIKTPILLVHGEADNNPGTFPIQSERLYNAIKGHGGTARYVVLPHESHGYAARESNLHLLWETVQWLDKYVKNAPKRTGTQ